MSRHPLTIYLPRETLVAVEKQARAAGMPKSAWAGQALGRALGSQNQSADLLLEQTLKVRATLDELIAAHPMKDAMRKRIDVRIERYLERARQAGAS
jgi:hypothetical protein